jgi:hypothetical protein
MHVVMVVVVVMVPARKPVFVPRTDEGGVGGSFVGCRLELRVLAGQGGHGECRGQSERGAGN